METSLFMNNQSKHLCLLAKKQFITDNDISLKLRGILDTVNSSNQIDAVLMKVYGFRLPVHSNFASRSRLLSLLIGSA